MKRHTIIGESLCGNLRSLAPLRAIIRHHHERLDGSGYPDGLRGQAVPVLAQVIGIVDAFPTDDESPVPIGLDGGRRLRGASLRGGARHDERGELVERFIATIQRDFDGAPMAERLSPPSGSGEMQSNTLAQQVPHLSALPDVHDRLEGLLADDGFSAEPAADLLPSR